MTTPQKVVIFYGPPGSGKGTQAQILADRLGYEHFNTGKLIEETVHDPRQQDDVIIQREKKLFDDGHLCTAEWVTGLVKEAIKKIHKSGRGIIFSGSPRTLYEAKHLYPYLKQLYGQENVHVVKIDIPPEESIFRNSHRRICAECGHSIVYSSENEKLTNCPKCQGKLVKRGSLDTPKTIKVRLKEYENRTVPIYQFLKKQGAEILNIKGRGSVEDVDRVVTQALHL